MFATKLHIDEQWMKQLSIGLKRFHKVKQGVHACRCPFCGDSKKSSTKTRFYFYTRKGTLLVQCKNCQYSRSFFNFVKDYSPQQFEEYKKETLFSGFNKRNTKKKPTTTNTLVENTTKPEFETHTTLRHCVEIKSLPENHTAVKYLKGRGFDESHFDRFLYTDDFKAVAEQIDSEASIKLEENEPRIVIPFYNKDREINLIQGRSLDPKNKMRYITIKTHDDVEKTYGLDRVDWSKTVYAVEGPFDSIFLDNCIATCDSNLIRSRADSLIFDNEPRNPDIIKLMEEAISQGRTVVVWPNSPNEKIDINDMVLKGVSPKMLMRLVDKCSYRGLTAKLKINQWKRV